MTDKQIDHLSYSQINTYLNCPLKYRFQYVDKIPPAFISAALAFGSAIHEAAAAFYQSCLEADLLRSDQLVDVYRQAWMSKGEAKIRYFNGDREQTLLSKAQSILEVFHDSFDPAGLDPGSRGILRAVPGRIAAVSRVHRPD